MKILIVEDEALIAMTYEIALKNNDFEVTDIAMSGEEAMVIAEKSSPDIALIDIALSGMMNGIDTARSIRARMGIPFIYITGNTDDATRIKAMETGPLEYLEKPVELDRLVSLLKKHSMSILPGQKPGFSN